MSIASFYNKTVDTQRWEDIAGTHKREWGDHLEDVSCAIHPINPELVNVQGAAFYKQYKMFCATGTDIRIDDRVVDGSTIYTVTGVSDYDDLTGDSDSHLRISLVEGE